MGNITDAAEEALLNAGMSASDAGIPLDDAVEMIKAAYTQAAIERGEDEDDVCQYVAIISDPTETDSAYGPFADLDAIFNWTRSQGIDDLRVSVYRITSPEEK